MERTSRNPDNAEMRHGDVILHYNAVTDRRAASVRLFPRAGTGVLDKKISHMGKKNVNPDLVCENIIYHELALEEVRLRWGSFFFF